MPRHKLWNCLLIDDSEDEVFLTRRLFKRSLIDLRIHHYATGEACLADAAIGDEEVTEQSILIADLNLVTISGIDVIRSLRCTASFSTTIMGICSGSVNPADSIAARSAGADFFVEKPLNLTALEEICRSVSSLEIARTAGNRIELFKHGNMEVR